MRLERENVDPPALGPSDISLSAGAHPRIFLKVKMELKKYPTHSRTHDKAFYREGQ